VGPYFGTSCKNPSHTAVADDRSDGESSFMRIWTDDVQQLLPSAKASTLWIDRRDHSRHQSEPTLTCKFDAVLEELH
jgi:hypothetical protein